MHVRTTNFLIQTGKMQNAIDIMNDAVVPAAKAQKGFQGLYLMTDATSGNALAISVWESESESDMTAGEASWYLQVQTAKFGSLMAGPLTTEHYELSVDVSA
jgi:heme-degrading monooxygenase HmoA